MPATTRAAAGASRAKRTKTAKQSNTTSDGVIVQANQHQWGFMKLPREVRDMICEYSSCTRKARQIVVSAPGQSTAAGCPNWLNGEPTIAMVSRAVREEALSIYYRRDTFAVMAPHLDLNPFDAWIKHVDERFLALIPSFWFIFRWGKDGTADLSAWVQSQRAKFKHSVEIQFRGEKSEADRFKQAIEIAIDLHNQHLEWSTIKDNMQKCNKMADVSSEGIEHLEDYDTDAWYEEALAVHTQFCKHTCRLCGHCNCEDPEEPCNDERCHGSHQDYYDEDCTCGDCYHLECEDD